MPREKGGPSDQGVLGVDEVATLEDIEAGAQVEGVSAEKMRALRQMANSRTGYEVVPDSDPDNPQEKPVSVVVYPGAPRMKSSMRKALIKSSHSGNEANSTQEREVSRNGIIKSILNKNDKGKKLDFKLRVDAEAGRRDIYILKLIVKSEPGQRVPPVKEITGTFPEIQEELKKYLGLPISTRA